MSNPAVTQKDIDSAIEGWSKDPAAMRKKILDMATDVNSLIMGMSIATHEQAAFNAMMRGEPCVVTSADKHNCRNCESMIVGSKVAHPTPQHLQIFRQAVWMGEPVRWVCELCMSPMNIKMTPNMEQLRRENYQG